jgi:hypothetical protein
VEALFSSLGAPVAERPASHLVTKFSNNIFFTGKGTPSKFSPTEMDLLQKNSFQHIESSLSYERVLFYSHRVHTFQYDATKSSHNFAISIEKDHAEKRKFQFCIVVSMHLLRMKNGTKEAIVLVSPLSRPSETTEQTRHIIPVKRESTRTASAIIRMTEVEAKAIFLSLQSCLYDFVMFKQH